MKFTISSSLLSSNLQTIGRVISSKSTLPILDYLLFDLRGEELKITASDTETTLVSTIKVDNQGKDGLVAVPARRISDSIREFSEQPLTLAVNADSWEITITWSSGHMTIPGITGAGYPELSQLQEERTELKLKSEILENGISNTIFATADDQLRPVMNGINILFSPKEITFVATDAHRLACMTNSGVTIDGEKSFILPDKPAKLIPNILPKDGEELIGVAFDDKNVMFTMPRYTLICRQIEGNYPNFNAVIPTNNNNVLVVDRLELMTAIRLVSVSASEASGLIKLTLTNNNLNITAQDIDYSTSAEDNLACQYDGADLEVGFKAPFLLDILSNLDCTDVEVKLSDATRPGLFIPVDSLKEGESLLMLLMPMMINV